ncbi:hypothetical protein Pstu01_35720 [Stutzerimonas stutzeri]|nr:hypothetical protein Pstu01_35720 [Stutzerimonas stutzeri]
MHTEPCGKRDLTAMQAEELPSLKLESIAPGRATQSSRCTPNPVWRDLAAMQAEGLPKEM